MFQVHSGYVEDKMQIFGDTNMEEGCIDFMYLTDLLAEYTNWTRDAVAKKSRFEEIKVT